eukprot:m.13872 g.13872  ORF g.13872 m.13872 type:complete len:549 (+) comp25278_c0_seq2:3519-5165(+)
MGGGDESGDVPLFKSKLGLVLACMGSVVGTGNIWRYPRIVANNSGDQGGLVFLVLWAIGLWVWSIPIILIEYAVGRYTRKPVITSFKEMVGPWSQWMGGWIAAVMLLIGGYYSVVLGWCFYYFVHSMFNELPHTLEDSRERWDNLHDSNYPLVCHAIASILAGVCIVRGVKTVEIANKIIVPLLLFLVLFSLGWSLSLPYAYEGITYLFSPDWDVLKTSQVWVDAVTQNAWDTGAAGGLFLTYATYMRRHDGVVTMGTLTPLANNFVSLCCGITIFCNVFSVLQMEGHDTAYVVSVLKDNGPANTGLTFIWMPLLYESVSVGGRVLAVLFFLSLSFAGLSSLIAMFELEARTLEDMGLSRYVAAIIVTVVFFLIGLASSLNLNVLVNQDAVWGFALIVSGLLLIFMVAYYGADKFRQVLVNEYGLEDWKLRKIWAIVISIISPLVGIALVVWWIVSSVRDDSRWYYLEKETLLTTFCEWAGLLIIVLALNGIYQCFFAKAKISLDTIQDGSIEVGKEHKSGSQKNEEYLVTRKLMTDKENPKEETSSL